MVPRRLVKRSSTAAGAPIHGDERNDDGAQRPGRDDAPSRKRRDPFGRLPPGDNGDPAGFVDIPSESTVQRSREIRDELRRRAGERARSRTDLDYIGRLLSMY